MTTQPEGTQKIAPHFTPVRAGDIPLTRNMVSSTITDKQARLIDKAKTAFAADTAKKFIYDSACSGMPALPLLRDIAMQSDVQSESYLPDELDTQLCPTGSETETDAETESTTEECLTSESSSSDSACSDSYANSVPDFQGPPLNLSNFSSWVYIFKQSSVIQDHSESSMAVSSLDPPLKVQPEDAADGTPSNFFVFLLITITLFLQFSMVVNRILASIATP